LEEKLAACEEVCGGGEGAFVAIGGRCGGHDVRQEYILLFS
jgi:hypothetical protein